MDRHDRYEETPSEPANIAQACIAAGMKLADLDVRTVDGRTFNNAAPIALVPDGMHVESLDEHVLQTPSRKCVGVSMATTESFIAYVNEHKTPSTRVFADALEAPYMFRAAIDYHAPGADGIPSFIEHVCCLQLRETPEWQAWTSASDRAFAQLDFAEFIEDRDVDFVDPAGARMLEIALTLKATESGRVKSHHRLASGSVALEYVHDVQAGAGQDGTIEIPEQFTVCLRPFEGSDPQEMIARFRYRHREGLIKFSYKLLRVSDVVRAAVESASKRIADGIGVQVFAGAYSTGE
jgi:uncharacterized protein YfdQ (DUF2303 family)